MHTSIPPDVAVCGNGRFLASDASESMYQCGTCIPPSGCAKVDDCANWGSEVIRTCTKKRSTTCTSATPFQAASGNRYDDQYYQCIECNEGTYGATLRCMPTDVCCIM